MRKTRFQALTMVVVMLFTMMAAGCKKSEKNSRKVKGEAKKAEAMLDDFCAYLKNGKYEKLEKLVDGKSSEVEKAKGFMKSEVEDIFASARKRLSFSIENVSLDKDETEGSAELVFDYFRTKDVIREVSSKATERDYRLAVEGAKKEEVRIEVELVREDNWLISEASTDKVFIALFSFLEDLNLEVAPTTPPEPTHAPIEINYTSWLNEDMNEVAGYRESATFLRFCVITWDSFYGETFSYEYEDENGNILYKADVTAEQGSDVIYCDWYPTQKIPGNYIACYVYDSAGTMITGSCVNIYGDDEPMPREFYASTYYYIGSEGETVPGYHVGDEYIALKMELYEYSDPPFEIYYEFIKDPNDYTNGEIVVYAGYITVSSDIMILPWENLPKLEPGEYECRVYTVWDYPSYYCPFKILPEGEDFTYDMPAATSYYGDFFEEEDGWSVTSTSQSTEKIYYIFYLDQSYSFMGYSYKLTDSKGKILDEGTTEVCYKMQVTLELNMKGAQTGDMKIEVFNPDGSLLIDGTIEVTK